jgi:TorA maturation chaperone TorD
MIDLSATRLDQERVDEALARAVTWRTLSVAFQPPTAARLAQLGAPEGFPVVRSALQRLAADDTLRRAADALVKMPVPDTDSIAAAYWRLFGHTTRGQICACETEYGPDNGFHQPQQLADISGYYLAFGLHPAFAGEARADHIACECEFMDFLNRKQALLTAAESRSAAMEETLEATEQAARTFLRDHLGRFGRAFAARLAADDRGRYYGVWGHVLLAFLDAECARAGVEGGPLDLTLRPEPTDEAPMACGSADELIQIQRRP